MVQLKYETVRAVEVDGRPIAQAALDYGLSRPTIYEAQENFRQAGIGGLLPKSGVLKRRANSRRKSASIWRSLLPQSPILKRLRSSKESDDASALCSIHALWKKQCEKKGVRHREKSIHFPRRSALLDTPL